MRAIGGVGSGKKGCWEEKNIRSHGSVAPARYLSRMKASAPASEGEEREEEEGGGRGCGEAGAKGMRVCRRRSKGMIV